MKSEVLGLSLNPSACGNRRQTDLSLWFTIWTVCKNCYKLLERVMNTANSVQQMSSIISFPFFFF